MTGSSSWKITEYLEKPEAKGIVNLLVIGTTGTADVIVRRVCYKLKLILNFEIKLGRKIKIAEISQSLYARLVHGRFWKQSCSFIDFLGRKQAFEKREPVSA